MLIVLVAPILAFNRPAQLLTQPCKSVLKYRSPDALRAVAPLLDECQLDEPIVECAIRRQFDGPWADTWARFVLLRPGMSYSKLKAATLKRNQLNPKDRIPGTFRTIVLTHAICFIAAIPAVLTSDAVFPKLIEAAALGRVMAQTDGFGL